LVSGMLPDDATAGLGQNGLPTLSWLQAGERGVGST
jgi:hypothetical protein